MLRRYLLFSGPVLFVVMLLAICLGQIGTPHKTSFETNASSLITPNCGWKLWRALDSEDAAAGYNYASDDLDWSTVVTSFSNINATDGLIDLHTLFPSSAVSPGVVPNQIEVAFFTDSDAAGDTFDFEIIAWKEGPYGPGVPLFITSGNSCVIGTMVCKKHPTLGTAQASGLWCDTLPLVTDAWEGVVELDEGGNNRIARLQVDVRGYRYLLILIYNADGVTTSPTNQCGSVGVVVSGL